MSATHSLAATAEMAVPFVRLDHDDPELLEELLGEVRAVAEESAFTLGSHVEDFEADFAAYCEADEAVGVASGTDALALSLRALGIGHGHEVIVPANTFIATAEAVSMAGATPRFVDVDPDSGLITAEIVERALTPRVRAVMPVHLYGATVDMDPLLEVARAAKIAVVEDACQAHGARYRGRRVGALGDIGCFSFYPAKNLGAWGDGGGVVTNRPELAERVRLLRSHGERPRYRHRVVGTTARLDALQAAILRVKLRHLDGWNAQRRRAAAELRRALQGYGRSGARRPGRRRRPRLPPVRRALRRPRPAARAPHGARHRLGRALPGGRAPHRGLRAISATSAGSLPVAEEMAEQVCSLPIFPGIDDEPDQRHRRGGGRRAQPDERRPADARREEESS